MNKIHVSDYVNNGIRGHKNYEFVDIVVNDDNRLFIDPMLIELVNNPWNKEANAIMQSFFGDFYEAYRQNNGFKKRALLSHAREQNGTRLGYGNGHNGKGNTVGGLIKIFHPLERLILDIKTMRKPEDLSILIPGFAEDGLSDLLTNILHDHLNQFTSVQLGKFGIRNNSDIEFWAWNISKSCWTKVKRPCLRIHGRELLFVPKNIVRKNYLFSTNQYFMRIILERMIEEGNYIIDGKPIPKKVILARKRYSGDHWEYNETIFYTKSNNDALDEYHLKLPGFYSEQGGSMKDKELDAYLYQ